MVGVILMPNYGIERYEILFFGQIPLRSESSTENTRWRLNCFREDPYVLHQNKLN